MEADQLEDSAKAYDSYGIVAECSCIRGSGGRGQQAAAGDCMDNPYKIDEDEVEDMFVIGKKPSGGSDKNEHSCSTADVISCMLVVPVVKCEPVAVGDNAEEASYDHCLEMAHEKRIFDEDDDEDVVVV